MRKVILALVLMTFSGMGIFAQTGIVTGTLRDQTDSSLLSGATIEILLQSDSSLVKTGISDSKGKFTLEGLVPED